MKKNLFIIVLIFLGLISSLDAQIKRYEIKSGKVVYKTNGGGKVMGMFESSIIGEEKLFFKEWGNIEIREQKETQTGMENIKTHSMFKFDNGAVYYVDFDNKSIYKTNISSMNSNKNMYNNLKGKEMIESIGGKKVGTGEFLGYECEIWEAMGTKMWIHKGILLKSVSNIMGLKSTTQAVEVKFNISISEENLALPNFPILKEENLKKEKMNNNDEMLKQEYKGQDLNKLMDLLGK